MANRDWKLLNAEDVAKSNPEFFIHPLLPFEQRCNPQLQETIKVTGMIKINGEWKLRGIWLQVEDNSNAPHSFIGRPNASHGLKWPADSDCTFEFGPEHIYRMEPRKYTVWGRGDTPVVVWGRDEGPQSPDEVPVPNIEPICVIEAPGWRTLKQAYTELAIENLWPSMHELNTALGW